MPALTVKNAAALRKLLQLNSSPATWSETWEWPQTRTVQTQRFSGNIRTKNGNYLLVYLILCNVFMRHHHHSHLTPRIRSFDLFRHQRIAIVSWSVHGLFFLEVCSWGRVSLLMDILFALGVLPTHPQNPHSWRTSLSLLVWPLSYGMSGLGGPTRNRNFPPS